jgi:hypothetical protein
MSKPKSSHRVFSRAFKLGIVNRMLAGEKMRALARELQFSSKDLYIWRDRFLCGGPEALRGPGRPRNSERSASRGGGGSSSPGAEGELDKAHRRIAALERKVGQQQVELDFFRQALRQVRGARRPSAGPGVTGSTKSSKR